MKIEKFEMEKILKCKTFFEIENIKKLKLKNIFDTDKHF